MNTEALKTFLVLAETKTVKKAAQQLFVVPSTVSSRLQELEKELGQALFERKPRGMELTPAGKRLLPMAGRMLALEQELRNAAIPEIRDQWKLSVGISDSLYYSYVEAFLPEFLYRYPDISLTIRSRSSADMLNMLRDNEIDLCVSFLPGTDPGMEAAMLSEEEIVLATTINNRDYVDGIMPDKLRELKVYYSECFNMTREPSQWREQVFPENYGFRLDMSVMHQLGSLLERTDGYAFVPRAFIAGQLERHTLQVIPLLFDPPPRLHSYLTVKKAQRQSYKAAGFITLLQQHISPGG